MFNSSSPTLSLTLSPASPQCRDRRERLSLLKKPHLRPPLRMERGVNSIVCKQRGHLFDAKEGSLQCEETPFSIGEGRFLVFSSAVPANEA